MIRLDDISVRAGGFHLNGIRMEIRTGEFGVLMGKTGSGKTTLAECICGLRPVERGRILLAGQDVTHLRSAARGVGYVPQDGALFPRMTVRGHLTFPLTIRRWRTTNINRRTAELAELLSIQHLLDRRAVGLSGGEAQRVALGRALAFGPSIMILDEPLSALDDETRHQMYELLKRVQRQTKLTTLHITHSQDEARRLADRLFMLRDGDVFATGDLHQQEQGETKQESLTA